MHWQLLICIILYYVIQDVDNSGLVRRRVGRRYVLATASPEIYSKQRQTLKGANYNRQKNYLYSDIYLSLQKLRYKIMKELSEDPIVLRNHVDDDDIFKAAAKGGKKIVHLKPREYKPGEQKPKEQKPTEQTSIEQTPTEPGWKPEESTPLPNGNNTVEWVPSSTRLIAKSLAKRAVVAGRDIDDSPLWVIRVPFEGHLIPGKLAYNRREAYFAWEGNETKVREFEVCCVKSRTIQWVESSDGAVPPNAVNAGYTSSGDYLYVGRAKHKESVTPGNVYPSHKALFIPFRGKEFEYKNYEVLCTA